ncbi:DUF4440 domain-containing protein [Brachybacterium sacelli]|uniref:DUF4440 domain-containing protein n=1 Tax=Brachybacterium sacelli TaxID=173364 RepID=A0ABS4X7E2_9MICO|nr:DUF4440 domain-containing protein [Brachybacterium sacelli]MBP2383634.1 hypothetical protein [Brachybacterium sacelli]
MDLALKELLAREPLTHRLPAQAPRDTIADLLDPEFREVGASGEVYDRGLVIDVVEERYRDGTDPDDSRWRLQDPSIRQLGEDLYLLTYTLEFDGCVSRRVTLWRLQTPVWRALYHQGTRCSSRDAV